MCVLGEKALNRKFRLVRVKSRQGLQEYAEDLIEQSCAFGNFSPAGETMWASSQLFFLVGTSILSYGEWTSNVIHFKLLYDLKVRQNW